MDATEISTSRRRGSRSGMVGVLFLTLVFVVYPLSTGPVGRAVNRGKLPYDKVMAFYAPLIAVVKGCAPLERFFDWYVLELWCGYKR
jgi:hypothetical protein